MKLPLRLLPFDHPRQRAGRLPLLVLGGVALLLLSLWDPIGTPGPTLCLARRAFAVPCPLCGVTRGVSLCLRGRPAEATIYNPLTVPIFIGGVGLMLVWAIEYIGNVRMVLPLSPPWRLLRTTLVFLILLAAWIYLFNYRREDEFADSYLGRLIHHFW